MKYKPGDKIGEWEIVKYFGDGKYTCRCSCGNERNIRTDSLSSGNSKSCGHKKEEDKKSWTGRKFGEWTVLGYLETGVLWCECSCGLQKKQYISTLTRGLSKSCGHSRLIGQRFGKLVVISRVDNSRDVNSAIKHLCTCDCGNNIEVFNRDLTSEYVNHCGCETDITKRELGIVDELGININAVERNSTIIGTDEMSIDIYIKPIQVGIEFNDGYWHEDKVYPKEYREDKTRIAGSQGVRLIHIYEHEWINNREKIKGYLRKKLGGVGTIDIAKCSIAEVGMNEARAFEDKYNLKGSRAASINIGIYHREKLVGMMAFGRSRYDKEHQYEIIRLTYGEFNITGGTEAMYNHFIDNFDVKNIVAYVDKSKFTGESYERIGMVKQEDTPPNYKYVKRTTKNGRQIVEVMTRETCQKHKLIEKGYGNLGSTEYEIMQALGYKRIYDAGNHKFTWSRE